MNLPELINDARCLSANGMSLVDGAELELWLRMLPTEEFPQTTSIQELTTEAGCALCPGMSMNAALEITLLNRISQPATPPVVIADPMDCATGCIMWTNPQSYPPGLIDGNQIAIWYDQSGNGNNLTCLAFLGPTFRANYYLGYHASEFIAANNDYYQSGPMATYWTGIDKPYTLFIVAKVKSVLTTGAFWGCSDSGGAPPEAWTLHSAIGTMNHRRTSDDGTVLINSAAAGVAPLVNFCLLTECYDGSTYRLWLNNTLLTNLAGLVTGKQFTSDTQNWHIGNVPPSPPYTYNLDGYVLDVAVFNRALTDAERGCVMAEYYNSRYALW